MPLCCVREGRILIFCRSILVSFPPSSTSHKLLGGSIAPVVALVEALPKTSVLRSESCKEVVYLVVGKYDSSGGEALSNAQCDSSMGSHGTTAIHIASETPPHSKNQLQLGPQSNPNTLEPPSRKRKQSQARQNSRCRGSKTVPCSWPGCDRVFVKKSNMTSHLSIHTGERPFKCPFKGCSMSFRVKSSMKYHISNAKSGHAGAMLPSSTALSREGPSPSATLPDDALSLCNVDSLSQQIASSEMHSLTGQKGPQQEGFVSAVTSSVSRGTSKGVNSEDCSLPNFSEECPSYASSEKGIPVSESLAPVNFLLGTTVANEQPFQPLEQDISSLAGVQLLLSAIDQADQLIGLCLGPPLNELCQLPEPLLPEQTSSPSKWSNMDIEGIRESLLL